MLQQCAQCGKKCQKIVGNSHICTGVGYIKPVCHGNQTELVADINLQNSIFCAQKVALKTTNAISC